LRLALAAPVIGLTATAVSTGRRGLAADAKVGAEVELPVAAAPAAPITAVVLGTPFARHLSRARGAVVAVLDGPIVTPRVVAGLTALLVLRRGDPTGSALFSFGLHVARMPSGAVAMFFVSPPLCVTASPASFAQVDPAYELAARTLGTSSSCAFREVGVPLATGRLSTSAVVMWARAVSEFVAVLVRAWRPHAAATLAYTRLAGCGFTAALPGAAALVIVALVPLSMLRALRTPVLGAMSLFQSRFP
jgi:ABC-type sulfate transport system permease component